MGHPRFHDNLVGAHALDWGVASCHFGDDGVVVVGIEPSLIADLAAGVGIERGVVEDDFAGFASLEFLCALSVLDDGQHLASVGASLTIAFEDGFWKLLIGRVRGLLGCAFPGGASPFALLSHGTMESVLI